MKINKEAVFMLGKVLNSLKDAFSALIWIGLGIIMLKKMEANIPLWCELFILYSSFLGGGFYGAFSFQKLKVDKQ